MPAPDFYGGGATATTPDFYGNGAGPVPATPAVAPLLPPATQGVPAAAPAQPVEDDKGVWLAHGEKLYAVPRDKLASVVQTLPGARLATAQEVQARKDEREAEADPHGQALTVVDQFGTSLLDAITAIPRGAAALASVGAGAVGLTKTEAALRDFVRDSGGEAFAGDVAYSAGGVEGQAQFVRNYLAREKAYPGTTALARGAGLVVPMIATAGAAGLAEAGAEGAGGAAQALASSLLAPTGIARTAIGGALQGLSGGLAAPFETMQDTPISREAILASGAMGAVFGGVVGGGAATVSKYAPGLVASVFRKAASSEERAAAQAEIRAALPDGIRAMEHSEVPAERELFESLTQKSSSAGELADQISGRIQRAINEAGPNPELRKEAAADAAKAEVERFSGKAKEISPENWRDPSLTPDEIVRNREALREGAKNEIAEHLGNLTEESQGVMEHLRNFEQKESLVRKNLSTLTDEQAGAAITDSLEHVRAQRAEFEGLFAGEGQVRPSRSSESLGFSLNRAEGAILEAKDATTAYRALDQLRRDVNARLSSLMRQTTSTLADDAFEGQKLFKWADNAYEATRQKLANPDVWGAQGRLQQKVNQAWADDIAAEGRVTKLGSFFSRDVNERYGRQALRVDPDKIGRYLDGLGRKSLPDQDLRAMVERKVALMKEVSAAYDIPAAQVTKATESARKLGDSITAANKVMTEAGGLETTVGNLLSSRVAKLAAHAGGGAIGGAVGALAGGHVGAVTGAVAGHAIGGAIEEFAAARIPALVGKVFSSVKGYKPNAIPQAYQRALNRNVTSMVPAAARGLFAATRDLGRAAQLEQHRQRSEVLAQLQQPETIFRQGESVLAQYNQVQPTLGASTQIAMQGKLAALAAEWPGTKTASPVPGLNRTLISEQDLRTANAKWEATTRPLSVFDDFESGRLDPEKLAFTWKQYPELQQLFQAAARDALAQLPKDASVPMDRLSGLDQLLGMGGQLDPALRPDFMARQLARGAQLRADDAAQQPNPAAAGRIAEQHKSAITRQMGV